MRDGWCGATVMVPGEGAASPGEHHAPVATARIIPIRRQIITASWADGCYRSEARPDSEPDQARIQVQVRIVRSEEIAALAFAASVGEECLTVGRGKPVRGHRGPGGGVHGHRVSAVEYVQAPLERLEVHLADGVVFGRLEIEADLPWP